MGALTRKQILVELRDMAILSVAGMLMTLFTCPNCYNSMRGFWIVGSFTSLMWISLWKGNEYLAHYLDQRISWLDAPMKRLSIGIILMLVYSVGVMLLINKFYVEVFDVTLIDDAWYSIIITIVISLFMHGRGFLISWRQSSVDAERLKRENIAAKYESLKNQVNPHFLFNSFNALSNLVHEDPDKAVKFIKQLSEVYRYVLDTREKEVVSLEEELKFLESYLYLQRIRFGEKLHVNLKLDNTNSFVAPLALQMLIENAIKHNVVSEDDPLHITIFQDGGFIIVENNLQKKSAIGDSVKVGLENIARRYEFLSSEPVRIDDTNGKFIVRLPILQSEKNS